MEEPQKYRVQIRQYPRAGGTTWHLDTGVIIGGDRAAVERTATYAIELLKQHKREWSPELPVSAPRTTQL
jgi:hypothetical protein